MTRPPVLLLLVCSTAVSFAFGVPSQLEHAKFFALGGIYESGRMSEGERALRALLRSSDASARLEALVSHASPAGQLYALLGLHLRDRAAYTRALQALRDKDVKVDTMRGCIAGSESFHALVSEIEQGKYDTSLSRPAW
jgi:hypothetical protein